MATSSEKRSDLDFTADLFKAADKLRGNLEPSEYKHVALGLIFLKYISDAFEAQRGKLFRTNMPIRRTPRNIWRKTSFGFRKRRAGPSSRQTPNAPRSVSFSTRRWMPSRKRLRTRV